MPVEPPELVLALPTTGHLILGDDTARFRGTFGSAPRLMTPWEIQLHESQLGSARLIITGRYADLEPTTGPSVTDDPLQHRSLVIGVQPGAAEHDEEPTSGEPR